MITIERSLSENELSSVHITSQILSEYDDIIQDSIFFDIETTGFTPKTATVYLIGCSYYKENSWNYIQWFAQTVDEEASILQAFLAFIQPYKQLIHFNGTRFDVPFIMGRCKTLDIPCIIKPCQTLNTPCSFEQESKEHVLLDQFPSLDLYKKIYPLQAFLHLENCKQKTIEDFLGCSRDDLYTGGELIDVYHSYLKNPTKESLDLLLLHNAEDVIGMIDLLPMLSYSELFTNETMVTKAICQSYEDMNGAICEEVLLTLLLPKSLPKEISFMANHCYFNGNNHVGYLRLPVYTGEYKYFYDNYKEYFYLPEEDMAIHQSVASFVEKSHKKRATASTCYTKKSGRFLPQWDNIISPVFREDAKSKPVYFELTDDFLNNVEAMGNYASQILNMLLQQ